MQAKNTQPFTMENKRHFTVILFRWRVLIAILFATGILLSQGCKKILEKTVSTPVLQQYFEANILNRDFIVSLATDTSKDLTAQYNGYIFRLTKNTLLDGPITGVLNGTTT